MRRPSPYQIGTSICPFFVPPCQHDLDLRFFGDHVTISKYPRRFPSSVGFTNLKVNWNTPGKQQHQHLGTTLHMSDKDSEVITIWLFNIAMENPNHMEVSSWENHLFLWAIYTMAMLVITRGYRRPARSFSTEQPRDWPTPSVWPKPVPSDSPHRGRTRSVWRAQGPWPVLIVGSMESLLDEFGSWLLWKIYSHLLNTLGFSGNI